LPVESSNPFDPSTPVERQARSRMTARVTSLMPFEPGTLTAQLLGLSTSRAPENGPTTGER
jgi:hypothetical protein